MGVEAELAKKVAKRAKAKAAADAALDDLYSAMLATFESGAGSYRQIAAATGLSRERVAQVLRDQRRKRQLAA